MAFVPRPGLPGAVGEGTADHNPELATSPVLQGGVIEIRG